MSKHRAQATPFRDLEDLMELFHESDWDELHLKSETIELFLSNDPGATLPGQGTPMTAAVQSPSSGANEVAVPPIQQPSAPEMRMLAREVPSGMVAIRAPNLGTFYRAPKPGATPYVEVGQAVDLETEVCLVEVMKLFTPVRAGVVGTIQEICVADGDMVEFDQVLFIVALSD